MVHSLETIAAIRFGYGFRPGEPDLGARDQLLQQISGADLAQQAFPTPGFQERMGLHRSFRALHKRVKNEDESAEPELKKAKVARRALVVNDVNMRCARAIFSPFGFRERLAAFWADHFTVIAKGQMPRVIHGDFLDRAIRPHIAGRFADLLIASTTHPSMLIFLDQTKSIGPNSKIGKKKKRGLNENLAREVLELHTMGVGGSYTQADVRQLAELLTGLIVTRKGMQYSKGAAEPGAETVLGKSYGGEKASETDILAFLEDLAVHPDTANYIAQKLVVHFVSDEPDPEMVAHIRDAFLTSGGDLQSVYTAMLEHPGAWVDIGGKVKQPFDFIVSGYRALNVQRDVISNLKPRDVWRIFEIPLISMGQPPRRALGPNGWPEEAEAWITPQGLAARLQWALVASARFGDGLDPRDFVLSSLREVAGETLKFAVAGSEKKIEGLALALSSPEFNRR
ncbi:MAG: DUF1800 domain-containing protein [Rhodobacteraceae bacterium]|nr:DUF1800 domain-containing protein [Paracoccaceae bacterium]